MAKDWEKYEDDVIDVDEVSGTDLKINPEYYIHTALLKAQSALLDENMNAGFLKYTLIVEHIESLCRASNLLDSDYDDEVKKVRASKEIKDLDSEGLRSVKVASKKIELMMSVVFNAKTVSGNLKA